MLVRNQAWRTAQCCGASQLSGRWGLRDVICWVEGSFGLLLVSDPRKWRKQAHLAGGRDLSQQCKQCDAVDAMHSAMHECMALLHAGLPMPSRAIPCPWVHAATMRHHASTLCAVLNRNAMDQYPVTIPAGLYRCVEAVGACGTAA